MAVIGITSIPMAAYRVPSDVQTIQGLNRSVMVQTHIAAVRRNQMIGTSARSPVLPKVFVAGAQVELQYFQGIGRTNRGGLKF